MNGQKGQEVLMGSENVTEVIRTNEVTNTVSKISAMTEIREFMVAEQQRIAKMVELSWMDVILEQLFYRRQI